MSKGYAQFSKRLKSSNTEEEVKKIYADYFDIVYNTTFRHDLYSEEIFFEFKYNKNLKSVTARAQVIAQVLYYIRRLKYDNAKVTIPPVICVADVDEAFLTETVLWRELYTDKKKRFDWDFAPSNPDPALVEALKEFVEIGKIHTYEIQNEQEFKLFEAEVKNYRNKQLSLDFQEKKVINEDNFEDVFDLWNGTFGETVRNGTKAARYFVCDIQHGRTRFDAKTSNVVFTFDNGEKRTKRILAKDYNWFWSNFEKIHDPHEIKNIIAKIDRLTDTPLRHFTGEFFTPVRFAKRANRYLEEVIGKAWWKKGYRLWDMASGTGNLEWFLPAEAYSSIYLSTLNIDDVKFCESLFPNATCFQYDYLNDDVDQIFDDNTLFAKNAKWKLPEKLRAELADPKLKWIILINPPFATSQKAGTSGGSKKKVSTTRVRHFMHEVDLGEVSRELFAQFLFRIRKEFSGKEAHLGLFSTLKYINSNNDQKFRDNFFHFGFEQGFIFSSANFSGTQKANPFPVGFLLWNLAKIKPLGKQKIEVEVLDDDAYKLRKKHISTANRKLFLSKWIERPDANIVYPPFGGAISLKLENKDTRNRVAPGFLASLMCKGNDVQNYNNVALLSGPYVSAGALSVVEANFEKAMVIHAVRKCVKKEWHNDRDQFMQPSGNLPTEFITQCVIWSLFASSNQTASLKEVIYQKKSYRIENHLFPFSHKTISKWQINDAGIRKNLQSDTTDRFASKWLADAKLTKGSNELLDAAKEIYKFFFESLNELPTSKYKIECWDAGWWQIRRALTEANLGKDLFSRVDEILDELINKIRDKAQDLDMIA